MGSDALYREAMGLPDDERATLAVRLLASVDEPAVEGTRSTVTIRRVPVGRFPLQNILLSGPFEGR